MFKLFAIDTYFNWGGTDITSVLQTVTGWLAAGVGTVILVGVIYGAIIYASANKNAAQAKKGLDTIRNAVIAMLLFFAMYGILKLLGVKL
ncbi:MAG: hypothetical protein WAW91_03215 [Candidatus Nanoperiomorbaceae bacterium]